jgi:uncharacterized membrane protein (UPF0127 family)
MTQLLINRDTGRIVAESVILARSPVSLFFGAMVKGIPTGSVLGLTPCNQIHTFFVPYPLDIVYCDSHGRVLRIDATISPNRLLARTPAAVTVWEARAGSLAPYVTLGAALLLTTVPPDPQG